MGKAKGKGSAKKPVKDVVRNDQIVRVLSVMGDLSRMGGADLYELAERYGTDERTIRRDLDALEEVGFKLSKERAADSSRMRWSIDADSSERVMKLLNHQHYLALRLAMTESKAVRSSNLFAVIEDISDKIEQAIGPRGRKQLEAVERCFISWEKFAWKKAPPDLMWKLVTAISNQNLVKVTYRAPSAGNAEKTYRVLPLKLLVHNGNFYVHAWKDQFKTVLLLNLNRLSALEVLEEKGEVPADYNPEHLESSAFGVFIGKGLETFTLRFDAFAAPYVEERSWHPSQELTRLADGSIELRFTCTSSYEVTNWVASWQHHVEVLEPKRLRTDLKAYAKWLTEKYGAEA